MSSPKVICRVPYSIQDCVTLNLSKLNKETFRISVFITEPLSIFNKDILPNAISSLDTLGFYQYKFTLESRADFTYLTHNADKVLPFLAERSALLPVYNEAMLSDVFYGQNTTREDILPYTRHSLEEMLQAVSFDPCKSCSSSPTIPSDCKDSIPVVDFLSTVSSLFGELRTGTYVAPSKEEANTYLSTPFTQQSSINKIPLDNILRNMFTMVGVPSSSVVSTSSTDSL